MKPRIKLSRLSFGSAPWVCSGQGYSALGDTPSDAYQQWVRGFQNYSGHKAVRTPHPRDKWMLWKYK